MCTFLKNYFTEPIKWAITYLPATTPHWPGVNKATYYKTGCERVWVDKDSLDAFCRPRPAGSETTFPSQRLKHPRHYETSKHVFHWKNNGPSSHKKMCWLHQYSYQPAWYKTRTLLFYGKDGVFRNVKLKHYGRFSHCNMLSCIIKYFIYSRQYRYGIVFLRVHNRTFCFSVLRGFYCLTCQNQFVEGSEKINVSSSHTPPHKKNVSASAVAVDTHFLYTPSTYYDMPDARPNWYSMWFHCMNQSSVHRAQCRFTPTRYKGKMT